MNSFVAMMTTLASLFLAGVAAAAPAGSAVPVVRHEEPAPVRAAVRLETFDDLARLKVSAGRAGVLSSRFVLGLLGLVGNLVVFAIWGFLAWKFVDGRGRARWRNHAGSSRV